jgi:hypothetical protein
MYTHTRANVRSIHRLYVQPALICNNSLCSDDPSVGKATGFGFEHAPIARDRTGEVRVSIADGRRLAPGGAM